MGYYLLGIVIEIYSAAIIKNKPPPLQAHGNLADFGHHV
jgi:hypothetical protein